MVDRRTRDRHETQSKYSSSKKRVEEHASGFEPTSYTVPEGYSRFWFKEARKYRLNILPYVVKTRGYKYADEGAWHFERTYFVHNGVGPLERKYTCMVRTFGDNYKCPCCEGVTAMLKEGMKKEDTREFTPKERQLFIVEDVDGDDGIQIFETAYYAGQGAMGFGQEIDQKMKLFDEDDERLAFYSLTEGMTLEVLVEKKTTPKGSYLAPTGIDFVKRKKQYSESLIEELPCLCDLIVPIEYAKLKSIYLQEPEENTGGRDATQVPPGRRQEREAAPKTNGSSAKKEDGYQKGDYVTYEGEECEVMKVGINGTLDLETQGGELYRRVDPSEVTRVPVKDEEENTEREETKPRGRR